MPELTDEEFTQARRLVQLVQGLQNNPQARQHLERGLKVLNPQMTTSEDAVGAIQAPLLAQIEELRAANTKRDEDAAAAETARVEREAVQRLEAGFGRLRENEGLTPEGEEKVRELMRSRNIFDPEAAFALFERQNPTVRSEQSSWTPDTWNYETDLMPDSKQWFADPDRAADQAVGQVLTEMRRNGSGEF